MVQTDGLCSSAEAASLYKTENQMALWIKCGFADCLGGVLPQHFKGRQRNGARSVGVPKYAIINILLTKRVSLCERADFALERELL